jgi:asparagine N-glycosylation enzyme membrane subunit Stt3
VDFWQSANYVIWSLAAILFLLPLAVVFYRVIEMSTLATVAYLAVAAGLIWCVVRLLSALRAGFAASPLRVYGTVVGIVALLIVVILAVLDNRLGTMTYLPFFQDVFVAR